MKCPICGRFMKAGGYYTNDHMDSFEETWRCSAPHNQIQFNKTEEES